MKILTITLLGLFGAGCTTSSVKPEFKPLPPEKLNDLLFQEPMRNIAYKSVTKEDYIIKEDC